MTKEYLGFIIVQNDNDKTLNIYRNGYPFIKADLDKSLTPLQLCAYGPMIFDRAKKVIMLIMDVEHEEIPKLLENVNWSFGPLRRFYVCSTSN